MFFSLWSALKQRGLAILQQVREQVRAWTKPIAQTLGVGVASDLLRSKAELILENVLLRQQLTVLDWQVKRPTFSWKLGDGLAGQQAVQLAASPTHCATG